MKKFIIIYSMISVVLFSIVVLVSLQLQTRSRTITVFNDIASEAHQQQDFDTFIGYQTLGYQMLEEASLDDINLFIYQAIGEQDDALLNQIVVIVNDKGDYQYATDLADENDQTNIVIVDEPTSTVIFSLAEEATNNEALSYGMSIYGFYYGAMTLDENREITVEVYDYTGDLYYEDTFDITVITDVDDEALESGLTDEEVDALIQRNEYITPEVIKDVTYFLVADIVLGAVIAFMLKRKKHHL